MHGRGGGMGARAGLSLEQYTPTAQLPITGTRRADKDYQGMVFFPNFLQVK